MKMIVKEWRRRDDDDDDDSSDEMEWFGEIVTLADIKMRWSPGTPTIDADVFNKQNARIRHALVLEMSVSKKDSSISTHIIRSLRRL
jgi:hypothetical protein